MPRYEADPTLVSAAITIFPKDEYEFILGKPKAFERTAAAGHQSYGIRIGATCASGPMAGKKTVLNFYLHSEGAQQMTKRFQMAVFGLTVSEDNEKTYNAAAAGQDWSYDTTDGSVGAAWAEYEGKHVIASLDVQEVADKNDPNKTMTQQQFLGWAPIQ